MRNLIVTLLMILTNPLLVVVTYAHLTSKENQK